ncbi:hypothetical protein UY3_14298 [Chelonia mydas]|uniref:Uncharacterized protein n=1 Tax=Chelonia mydas TaxID=8469 RepID=M7BK60_CHEMY|nr:hypothetical protein UY3_14298 [Chelonia mydas]
MNSKKEEVVEEKEKEYGEQNDNDTIPLCVLSAAAAIAAFRPSHLHHCRTPEPNEEQKEEDTGDSRRVQEAHAVSDHEHRAWMNDTGNSLEKERVKRIKAQEKERKIHQDTMGLFRQQTQIQRSWGPPPSAAH